MRLCLDIRPLSGLEAQDEPGVWLAMEPGPLFALTPPAPVRPGWWRLRMDMRRICGNNDARLILKPADGSTAREIRLPMAINGLLDHVFRIPFAVVAMELRPFPGTGVTRMGEATLEHLGPVKRLALMAARVGLHFWKVGGEKSLARLDEVALTPDVVLVQDGSRLERLYRLTKRRMALRSLPFSEYGLWISLVEQTQAPPPVPMHPHASRLISVIVLLDKNIDAARASLRSLERQSLAGCEKLLAAPPEAQATATQLEQEFPGAVTVSTSKAGAVQISTAVAASHGDYALFLLPGDELSHSALAWLADALLRNPELAVLYADEDRLGPEGDRREPLFKPGWDPELLPGFNYIGPSFTCAKSLVQAVSLPEGLGHEATLYALALAATQAAGADRIGSIAKVLVHRRSAAGQTLAQSLDDETLTVARQYCARHLPGFEVSAGSGPSLRIVRPPEPDRWPLVSVIIPTRDGIRVLRPCLEGLLKRTDYPQLEIIVADNGSRESHTLDYLRDLEACGAVRVLRLDMPFNWSRLNNICARQAKGEVLLFLNDDVEVREPGWLKTMVAQALRPEIGAVGALLLYPCGLVQHAGIVLGLYGTAGHVYKGVEPTRAGPWAISLNCTRTVSAVTGACLVLRREIFQAVDGFDERLAVAFNDVDLCLRAEEVGYRNLLTPQALLLHHESVSRGGGLTSTRQRVYTEEKRLMKRRWPDLSDTDRFYNRNLTHETDDGGAALNS